MASRSSAGIFAPEKISTGYPRKNWAVNSLDYIP
jgi:hypothetical protein